MHDAVLGRQAPAEAHGMAEFRPHEFPGIAVDEPAVGLLHLLAVHDALREHAEVVTDAIAHAGQADAGDGVQKTGCQAPQAAVSEAGVGFQIRDRIKVGTQLCAGGLGLFVNTQGHQRVGQHAPGQELH